jgi:hypothetical protein
VSERRYSAPDWTANAWRQERMHFQPWGRKERKELSGPDGGAIKVSDPFMQSLVHLWETNRAETSHDGHHT